MTDYTSMFNAHDDKRDWRRGHARGVVSLLLNYIQPKSVIDMGCGMGFFLAEMERNGATIHGVDGPWTEELETEVPLSNYTIQDLNSPYVSDKRYDLCSSLEVAEHLEPERSEPFVDELVALSDTVLFSAAIPGQKGHGHINCQWQADWANRFAERGYTCYDPFRRRLVGIEGMAPWFMQNLLLFIKTGVDVSPALAEHKIPPAAASYILPKWHNQRINHLQTRMQDLRNELDEARGIKVSSPRPPRHAKPREDLTVLEGIGPVMQDKLYAVGVTQVHQIAGWIEKDVRWAEKKLGAVAGPGDWMACVEQAKTVATQSPRAEDA